MKLIKQLMEASDRAKLKSTIKSEISKAKKTLESEATDPQKRYAERCIKAWESCLEMLEAGSSVEDVWKKFQSFSD